MKSVTRVRSVAGRYEQNFNPHTREECDQFIIASADAYKNFNPHTREECDIQR